MALVLPNSIDNDTPADAAELQQNYSAIQTYVNANLIHRDGSVAMQQPLTLPGDPTNANHAANKDYVDGRDELYLPLAGGTVSGATVFSAGGTFNEDVTLGATADLLLPTATSTLGFGSRLGQHINLFGTTFGIGIQPNSMYFRVADGGVFRFYHGGVHSDVAGTAGTGGVGNVAITPTAVLLPDTQSSNANAAVHRQYVDDAMAAADTAHVQTSGAETMTGPLTVGTTGVVSQFVRVGGDPANEIAGVQMRGDGHVNSRMEDPTGITGPNIFLARAGATAAAPTAMFVSFNRAASTAGAAVNVGTIRVNAGGSGVDYNESSDYRLKDDLGPVDNAVERLAGLQPKRFRWKESGVEQDGFFAHEVAEVIPNAVSGEKDGTELQQLAPMRLIPLLVAAVQQLTARVAELEAV